MYTDLPEVKQKGKSQNIWPNRHCSPNSQTKHRHLKTCEVYGALRVTTATNIKPSPTFHQINSNPHTQDLIKGKCIYFQALKTIYLSFSYLIQDCQLSKKIINYTKRKDTKKKLQSSEPHLIMTKMWNFKIMVINIFKALKKKVGNM